jgi:hypothetical protein
LWQFVIERFVNEQSTKLWAQTRVRVWPERYWLVSLSQAGLTNAVTAITASLARFAAIVLEHDEISLTVCDEVWQKFAGQVEYNGAAGPYRVITFILNVDLGTSGYLLPAATRLAEAGISILPQCAYLKDHLVIKEEDTAQAVEIIKRLIAECQQRVVR